MKQWDIWTCGFAFADGHSQIKKWTGQLAGPDWAVPVYKDRHAGVLKCTATPDKNDIDWVKDRMADPCGRRGKTGLNGAD